MSISKIIFNNSTFFDLTSDTVESDNLHNDYTALGKNGVLVEGEIPATTKENEIITKTLSGSYTNTNIVSLVDYAFINQSLLTSLTVGNLTSIPQYAFYGCSSLTNLSNLSEVTTIDNYAFYNCSSINNIIVPKCINIGTNSLNGTGITSITDVNFPVLGVNSRYIVLLRLSSTCTSIKLTGEQISLYSGSGALRDCVGLVTAEFPNAAKNVGASYRNIGSYCFGGCTNLLLADCGFVRSVGGNAFNGATNITTIVLRYTSVVSLSNTNAFTNTPFKNGGTGGTIYIPKVLYDELGTGSSNDYKAATNWSTVDGYGTITWAKIEGSQYDYSEQS